jgi:protocatechuate 3,4-dioxygenase beta subunit
LLTYFQPITKFIGVTKMKNFIGMNVIGFTILTLLVAGCGSAGEIEATVTSALVTPTQPELEEPIAAPGAEMPTMAVPSTLMPSPTPVPTSTLDFGGEPLPLTPSQTEGPYYPVEKPTDRDNDLTQVASSSTPARGEVVLLSGRLIDEMGRPIAEAVIEIWQTDANGIYLHPNDPGVANRDPNFQSYGEAVTGTDGSFNFRTIRPGFYGGRPEHIHVKVKLNGLELLTTQFYFAGDERLGSDAIASGAGSSVVLVLQPGSDAQGNLVWTASQDIILAASAVP